MAGRKGMTWKGQRAEPLASDRDIVDPARGEVVQRCRACGMPDRPSALLEPGLWMIQRFQMELVLCRNCSTPGKDGQCRLCEAVPRHGNKVMEGVWAYVKRHLDMLVCEACVIRYAPQFDVRLADPVTLDEVA